MDQPDFRALCAELMYALSAYDECDDGEEVSQHWNYTNCNELLYRTRTALATSLPEPPTDEELLRLYGVSTPCYHVEEFKRELNFARAVLDRWGHG